MKTPNQTQTISLVLSSPAIDDNTNNGLWGLLGLVLVWLLVL